MINIREVLKSGDLRSDGNADQVAEYIHQDNSRLMELLPCLDDPDSVIRAHAAHAIEVITRKNPDLLAGETRRIIMRAESDAYPVVRWHMVMTLGNLAGHYKVAQPVMESLLRSLKDTSPLVRSWAVYSLVSVGRKHLDLNTRILSELRTHGRDHSPAVRSRLNRAITLLQFPDMPMPITWMKSSEK
ncbi:MAG: HEAT repeat domain-containing protein [Anaerolineaceae bacterium]|nr:HEAT repeat domain-containing protein [Anaerolineaceae bacterium]